MFCESGCTPPSLNASWVIWHITIQIQELIRDRLNISSSSLRLLPFEYRFAPSCICFASLLIGDAHLLLSKVSLMLGALSVELCLSRLALCPLRLCRRLGCLTLRSSTLVTSHTRLPARGPHRARHRQQNHCCRGNSNGVAPNKLTRPIADAVALGKDRQPRQMSAEVLAELLDGSISPVWFFSERHQGDVVELT